MIFLILVIVILCLCTAYIPMPQPLKVGFWIVAGLILLYMALSLVGAIDGPDYFRFGRSTRL